MNQRRVFEPVRVGVVGLGRFGRLHALTLARLAEADLAGVVARREASIEQLRRDLPSVEGWANLDEAIAQSGAEAWVVACTTSEHVRVATRLLSAGKKVLLEKPIAESLDEAEQLRPLVDADSSNLMLGHIVLFNSEFRALRDEVRRHGKLRFIDCVRHRPATIVKDFPGENPLHAAMVHDLYMAQAIVGTEEPIRYSAQYRRLPDGAIDLAMAQLHWPDGTVGSFKASYLTPAGMAPRGFDRMEVFGDGWSARIEPNPRPINVWDTQAHWPMALEIRADAAGATGMMAEELRHFCRVVRGIEPIVAGASYFDALQVQRWLERLDVAARSAESAG